MQQKVFGLPVDLAVIFSNYKNAYKKRIEKRQRWFRSLFLEIDEKILQVTTGYSPTTIFEKMGVGWGFVYLKRSLLVFTDRRIFHVPTTEPRKTPSKPSYRFQEKSHAPIARKVRVIKARTVSSGPTSMRPAPSFMIFLTAFSR